MSRCTHGTADQKPTVMRWRVGLRGTEEWQRVMQEWVDLEPTAGSDEYVREPARGMQQEVRSKRYTTTSVLGGYRHQAHTCTDIYAGHTPIHKVFKKTSSAAHEPICTSLKCTSLGVAL